MKRQVIALKKVSQEIMFDGVNYLLTCPKDVSGVLYCFDDVESARKYFNNVLDDIELIDSETKKNLDSLKYLIYRG